MRFLKETAPEPYTIPAEAERTTEVVIPGKPFMRDTIVWTDNGVEYTIRRWYRTDAAELPSHVKSEFTTFTHSPLRDRPNVLTNWDVVVIGAKIFAMSAAVAVVIALLA